MIDPTRRFSDHVALYAEHRTVYLADIIKLLEIEGGLECGGDRYRTRHRSAGQIIEAWRIDILIDSKAEWIDDRVSL